jgi:amino acid permease
MKNFGKLAFPHLIGLLAYSIILKIIDQNMKGEMMFFLALLIIAHVMLCGLLAIYKFTKSETESGAFYLLIAFLVLLIGFGTCVSFFTLNVH